MKWNSQPTIFNIQYSIFNIQFFWLLTLHSDSHRGRLILPQAEHVAGNGDGNGVAEGGDTDDFDWFSGDTTHFKEFQRKLIVGE